MRNAIFFGALAAAVAAGGLIGWFGDFSMLIDDRAAASASAAPVDPFAPRVDGLDFSIDATRTREEKRNYPSGYIPAGDYGYEPNGCAMPQARSDSRTVLLGIYSGDAISTVALESQDHETGVVEVVIEPGQQPLYVVLSAFKPTIWRFSGATERVERAVMVASKGGEGRVITHASEASPRRRPGNANATAAARAASRAASRAADDARRAAQNGRRRMTTPTTKYAGVIGLPADRVSTSEDIRCFDYFNETDSMKATQAATVVRRASGRAPDVLAGYYSPAAVSLPSGRIAEGTKRLRPPAGYHAPMWREFVRFSPWGISSVRQDAIISAVGTTRYEVLPNQAGLSQLIGSGHLKPTSAGLEIVKPIPRFPAELTGAHATQFVLPAGIPVPSGDPGHSCVVRKPESGAPDVRMNCPF